jgi:hypothetical protein
MNNDIINKIKCCAKAIDDFIKFDDYDLANFHLGKMSGMIQIAFECGAITPSLHDSMVSDYLDYLDKVSHLYHHQY